MSSLSFNVVLWLFECDTVEATKYLVYNRIPFQIMKSDQGYWINVHWPNGIIAALTFQELCQLPEYKILRRS